MIQHAQRTTHQARTRTAEVKLHQLGPRQHSCKRTSAVVADAVGRESQLTQLRPWQDSRERHGPSIKQFVC